MVHVQSRLSVRVAHGSVRLQLSKIRITPLPFRVTIGAVVSTGVSHGSNGSLQPSSSSPFVYPSPSSSSSG